MEKIQELRQKYDKINASPKMEEELKKKYLAQLQKQIDELEVKEKPSQSQSPSSSTKKVEDLKEEMNLSECMAELKKYKEQIAVAEREALAAQARSKGEKITSEEAQKMPKGELMERAGQAKNTITPKEGKEKAIENLVKWELKGNETIKKRVENLKADEKQAFSKKRDALIAEAQAEIKRVTQKILDDLEKKLESLL